MPEFINPPPAGSVGEYASNLNFALGSTVTLSWTGSVADSSGMNLWLKSDLHGYTCTELNLADTLCWLIDQNNQGTSFDWYVNIPDFDGASYNSNQPVYYVHMYDSQNLQSDFGSHYFNVLPASLMPTSSAASTSTPSSTSAQTLLTTTISTGTSATTSPTQSTTSSTSGTASASNSNGAGASATSGASSSSPSTSSGSSDTTKIALGVGLGIGIPLVLVLAVIAWLLYRNNRRKEARNESVIADNDYNVPPAYHDMSGPYMPPQQQSPVHEMSTQQSYRITSPTELDGRPYK